MIKIKKLVIKNFRSIIKLQLDFNSEYNYSIFCGKNNVGKTNILRAINMFFNEDIFDVKYDKPNHIYEATGSTASKTSIYMEFEGINKEEITDIEKIFSLDNIEKKSKKLKDDEKLIEDFLKKFNCFFIDSINQNLPEVINILFKDDTLTNTFKNSTFRGAKSSIKNAYIKYASGMNDIFKQLSNEINELFHKYNSSWNVNISIPDKPDRFLDLISSDTELKINDGNNKTLYTKGSGLQRLTHILLYFNLIEKMTQKNIIILLDEPEIYLHSTAQKQLFKDIKNIKNGQCFITTHSDDFIDTYNLTNLFLIDIKETPTEYQRKNNKTFIKKETYEIELNNNNIEAELCKNLGIKNKSLLESYNILVEGDTDLIYIKELSKFFDIELPNIISYKGTDNIKSTLNVYDSYYNSSNKNPKILVIFDNDSKGRESYRNINNNIKSKQYKNLLIKTCLIPNYENNEKLLNNSSINNNNCKYNIEIEDFIYPELFLFLFQVLFKNKEIDKKIMDKIKKDIKEEDKRLNKGILEIFDYQLDNNLGIKIKDVSIKNNIANVFQSQNINNKKNKKLIDTLNDCKNKYPEVKKFLEKLQNFDNFE